MEPQTRPGFDGIRGVATQGNIARAPVKLPGCILRIKAVVSTLVATIVMGVAKQNLSVDVVDPINENVQTLYGTVKSTYSAAFVYFTVVNSIVFIYSSISLAMSVASRSSSGNTELPLAVGDLMMVTLLFSGNGAAIAITMVAEQGQNRLGWTKICDFVGTFCAHVKSSIVLSMLASLAYVLLVLLAIIGLKRRSQ